MRFLVALVLGVSACMDGRVVGSSTRRTVNGQPVTESTTENGTYGLMGNSIFLRNSVGGTTQVATINGNTMTMGRPGQTLVFSK